MNTISATKYLIVILILASIFSKSCEKFLETDSPSAFTNVYIFTSEEDTRKALNGVYQTFASSGFDERILNAFALNTDIANGHVHAGTDNTRRDLWSYRATATNTEILITWNNAYLAINRANEVIEGIRNGDLYKEGNKPITHMLGEALAIRSYYYFLLQFYWGDVPFTTEPTKAGDEFYLPRTDRDTILAHSIEDLISIETEMYWADQLPEGIERISRDFVIALISKLSLARGGYALRKDGTMRRSDDCLDYYKLANSYCKKLIELKPRMLDPDFQQVFRNQCEYISTTNQDVIYEIAYLPGVNGDIGWNHGLKVHSGNHVYGEGNNAHKLSPDYFYSFDTTDTRFKVSCSMYLYDEDLIQQPVDWIIMISTHKWSRTWVSTPLGETSAKGTGINFPLMRYANVLLMLAETDNELNNGPTVLAQDALREIRQRAFPAEFWSEKVDNYINEVSVSKESFFDALVDERAWEFGSESLRKFDLVRWNLLGKKIMQSRETLTQFAVDAYKDDGPTSHLADVLYYRIINGKIEFYNETARRPAVIPPLKDVPNIGDNPDGYETVRWLTGLSKQQYGEETGPIDFVDIQWSGYTDNAVTGDEPVPYILPIHQSIVNSSRGALDNNGYLLTF